MPSVTVGQTAETPRLPHPYCGRHLGDVATAIAGRLPAQKIGHRPRLLPTDDLGPRQIGRAQAIDLVDLRRVDHPAAGHARSVDADDADLRRQLPGLAPAHDHVMPGPATAGQRQCDRRFFRSAGEGALVNPAHLEHDAHRLRQSIALPPPLERNTRRGRDVAVPARIDDDTGGDVVQPFLVEHLDATDPDAVENRAGAPGVQQQAGAGFRDRLAKTRSASLGFSRSRRSVNSVTIGWGCLHQPMIGCTRPLTSAPPRRPLRSSSSTRHPWRAAAMAALTPPRPPPPTKTSHGDDAKRLSLFMWCSFVFVPVAPGSRVPAHQDSRPSSVAISIRQRDPPCGVLR